MRASQIWRNATALSVKKFSSSHQPWEAGNYKRWNYSFQKLTNRAQWLINFSPTCRSTTQGNLWEPDHQWGQVFPWLENADRCKCFMAHLSADRTKAAQRCWGVSSFLICQGHDKKIKRATQGWTLCSHPSVVTCFPLSPNNATAAVGVYLLAGFHLFPKVSGGLHWNYNDPSYVSAQTTSCFSLILIPLFCHS